MRKEKLTFGLIVGTRGVFSAELARSGRRQLLDQVKKLGHHAVILPQDATPSGAVSEAPTTTPVSFRLPNGAVTRLPMAGSMLVGTR